MQSILNTIFGNASKKIPEVFHKRYANRPASQDVIIFEGQLTIHYSPIIVLLMPLFRLVGALVPYQGKDIPVTVHFRSEPDSNIIHFDRTFYFPDKKPYPFFSMIEPIKNNCLVECMKFGIGYQMHCFYNGEKVIYQHQKYVWKLFGKFISLPISLLAGKAYAEEVPISDNAYQMLMHITHPLFGKIFEYRGEFHFVSDQ